MENLSFACQIIVSVSVLYIWVFRYDNIILEFKHYGYSDLLRNAVGASKISISAIMIMGIWFNEVIVYASLSMAFFMLCAQASHLKVKNPIVKFMIFGNSQRSYSALMIITRPANRAPRPHLTVFGRTNNSPNLFLNQ